MKIISEIIDLESTEKIDFMDVTKKVVDLVKKSHINNGIANIYTTHTTTAIRVNENEPRLLQDFKYFLEQKVSSCNNYLHDEIEKRAVPINEKINAHSHLKVLLLGTSESIPLLNQKLQLGTWQSIFFIDCDGPQKRKMHVTIIGN